jgi:hypothetical protein
MTELPHDMITIWLRTNYRYVPIISIYLFLLKVIRYSIRFDMYRVSHHCYDTVYRIVSEKRYGALHV